MSSLEASQKRINALSSLPGCSETKITSLGGVSLTFTEECGVYFNGNSLSQLHDVALDELKGLELRGMSEHHHELLQKAIRDEQFRRQRSPVGERLNLVAMLDAALRQGGESDVTPEQRIDIVYGLARGGIYYTHPGPGGTGDYLLHIDFTTPELLTSVRVGGELRVGGPMDFRSVINDIAAAFSVKSAVHTPTPTVGPRADSLRANSARYKFITGLMRDPNRTHTNRALFEATLSRIIDGITGSEVRQGYEIGLIDRWEFKAEIYLDRFKYPVNILESRLSGFQAGQTVTLSAFIDLLISSQRETT